MKKERTFRGYLVVGFLNTALGYFIGVGIYSALRNTYDVLFIGIVTNIVTIGISYINYKFFYFGKSHNIIHEIIKFYSGYLLASTITIALYTFMIKIGISIWLVQFALIFVSFLITYITNNKFVFTKK
jgi:putative flippase GtrA